MRTKLKFVLCLLFSAAAAVLLYIIIHEAGHMIVMHYAGATITDFSISGAHVSATGGSYTDLSDLWLHANGAVLPVLFSFVYLLLYKRSAKSMLYRVFSYFAGLIPAVALLTWVAIPFAYTHGSAPANDDVTKFLINFSQSYNPYIVSICAALLFGILVLLMVKKCVLRNFFETAKSIKLSAGQYDRNSKPGISEIILRVLAILLAAVLLAAGVFWFYCRVINDRSFMAGLTDLVLTVQHRSDKFTDLSVCEEYIAEKAVDNLEPVVIGSPKFDVSLREEKAMPLQAFIYNEQKFPSQIVFYFHGGAYINQPNNQQTTLAARTAYETGAEVVLVVYPKEPVYTCEESYEACIDYYLKYLSRKVCGKVVFMGDSAGGGLALGLAEALRDMGKTGPNELVLISPWVDLTMSNPDMQDYVKKDAMLGIDGLRRMGEVWAGELDVTDSRVSPLYGDLSGLCPVTLTTGTWEILYPDTQLLYEKLTEAGVEVDYIVGERMMHCYPICPIPEAKAAQSAIWNAIERQ